MGVLPGAGPHVARSGAERGHLALAELERRGFVQAIVTQNIDTLHTRAGSREVVEVHGSIRYGRVSRPAERRRLDAVLAQLEEHDAALSRLRRRPQAGGRRCSASCSRPAAMERATALARGAALMLVVGSSLEVWPAAGLPLEAGSLAIVNRGPTGLDEHASCGSTRARERRSRARRRLD